MPTHFIRNLTQLRVCSFHSSRHVFDEWTKASLRRMKKPELVQLAKDSKLNGSGTKNEIIIRLLSHQTAKIVGNSTPTLHSIKKALEEEEEEEKKEADELWMNAFEMKVSQRRGLLHKQQEHHSSSKPHPMNDNLKPKITLPLQQEETTSEPCSDDKLKIEDESDQDINKEWVKAFDLKVGSRASKKPSISEITFDSLKTVDHPVSQKDHNNNNHPTFSKDQPRALITTVIGSSMLIWYFGGSQGFSNIWQFFSS